VIALLFGGQGSETPRMGEVLAAENDTADALLRHARDVASGDPRRTSVLQPLLTAVGLGAAAALAEAGITPAFVAGHSLGEVCAWSVAGALTSTAAIELAAIRGRAMEREAGLHPGGMIAISCDEPTLQELLHTGRSAGSVVLAAHNGPQDWTLSGDSRALALIASRIAATKLVVSGAWHSPAMAGAVEEVLAAARARCGQTARAIVVTNRTGALAPADADVAELLAEQLVRPIQWTATLRTLAAAGVTRYVIAGPGTVLRGLVYKTLGRVPVTIVESRADIDALLAAERA
jgi:malonyl CoA-acyl carrier protein transacylase